MPITLMDNKGYLRSTRTIRTYFASVLTSLMVTFFTLISTPFLIGWMGSDSFGLYRVALDWLSYLTVLDFGLNETLIPILIRAHSTANTDDVISAFVAGFRSYVRILPFKVAIGIIFIILTPILITSDVSVSDLRIGCTIGLVIALLSPLHPFKVLLEVKQVAYRIHKIMLLKTLSTLALGLYFAKNQYGVTGQFVAVFVGDILFHLFVCSYVLTYYPSLLKALFLKKVNQKDSENIRTLRTSNFLSDLCSRLSYMSDNIIISLAMNIEKVTPFIMSQRLITFANQHLFGISNATWASMAHLHARGDREQFQKRFIELNKFIVTVGLVTLGPIAAFNQAFISLWLGPAFYGGHLLTFFASINSILLSIIAFWSWIFTAKGISGKLLPQYIAFSIINFLTSILFTRKLGIYGPQLGTFVAILMVTIWVIPKFLEKHFEIPPAKIAFGILQPVFILAPFILVVWFVGKFTAPQHWYSLLLCLSVCCSFLAWVSWVWILSPSERTVWAHRIKLKLRLVL